MTDVNGDPQMPNNGEITMMVLPHLVETILLLKSKKQTTTIKANIVLYRQYLSVLSTLIGEDNLKMFVVEGTRKGKPVELYRYECDWGYGGMYNNQEDMFSQIILDYLYIRDEIASIMMPPFEGDKKTIIF